MQVLEDGQVVLVKLEEHHSREALPYDMARNSARADLLETMTEESLNKAASELRTELDKAPDAIEQFNAIASKAGAKTAIGPSSIRTSFSTAFTARTRRVRKNSRPSWTRP